MEVTHYCHPKTDHMTCRTYKRSFHDHLFSNNIEMPAPLALMPNSVHRDVIMSEAFFFFWTWHGASHFCIPNMKPTLRKLIWCLFFASVCALWTNLYFHVLCCTHGASSTVFQRNIIWSENVSKCLVCMCPSACLEASGFYPRYRYWDTLHGSWDVVECGGTWVSSTLMRVKSASHVCLDCTCISCVYIISTQLPN